MLAGVPILAASIGLALMMPVASAQEALVGTYGESRTVLAFRIPDDTVQKALPHGWLASPLGRGPSQGANLLVTFMDWLVAQNPDGTPANTYRTVGLSMPAIQRGAN